MVVNSRMLVMGLQANFRFIIEAVADSLIIIVSCAHEWVIILIAISEADCEGSPALPESFKTKMLACDWHSYFLPFWRVLCSASQV